MPEEKGWSYGSRWNYIFCGIAVYAAFIGATHHDLLFLILNGFFTWFNWHVGELKRSEENEALLKSEKLGTEDDPPE